jgi:hypothetical protein
MNLKTLLVAGVVLAALSGCDQTPSLELAKYNGHAPGDLMGDKQIGGEINAMIPPDRKLCLTDFYNYLPDLSLKPDGSLESSLDGSHADNWMIGYMSVLKNGQIFIALDCSTDGQNPVKGAGLELYTNANITPSGVPKSVTSWIMDGQSITYSNLFFSPAGKPASEISVAQLETPTTPPDGAASKKSFNKLTFAEAKSLGESAVKGDDTVALKKLEVYAKNGDANAQLILGNVEFKHNPTAAVSLLTESANQGNAKAQTLLGGVYAEGKIAPQDYAKAFSWFLKAANQGEAAAQNAVGNCYYKGWGVPQSDAKASWWWRKAAAQGYEQSQRNLDRFAQQNQQSESAPALYATTMVMDIDRSIPACNILAQDILIVGNNTRLPFYIAKMQMNSLFRNMPGMCLKY